MQESGEERFGVFAGVVQEAVGDGVGFGRFHKAVCGGVGLLQRNRAEDALVLDIDLEGIVVNFGAEDSDLREGDPDGGGGLVQVDFDRAEVKAGFDDDVVAVDVSALGEGDREIAQLLVGLDGAHFGAVGGLGGQLADVFKAEAGGFALPGELAADPEADGGEDRGGGQGAEEEL